MNWLLFFLLGLLHPVVFIAIWVLTKTWKMRLLLWALLPLPAIWYCWDYYAIQVEHQRLCAEEGGLKVLVTPEKSDRVRLLGDSYRAESAKGLLASYYPKLQVVEARSGRRGGNGQLIQEYFAYRAAPNPHAGQPMKKDPWKEPKLLVSETSVSALDGPAAYEISQHEFQIPNGRRTETVLVRDGRIYAKYSKFVHWWTGIRYPDALPTWFCPDQRLSKTYILSYEPLVELLIGEQGGEK